MRESRREETKGKVEASAEESGALPGRTATQTTLPADRDAYASMIV